MEFTPVSPIRPLIETAETQSAQSGRSAGISLFSTVFQSAINDVRETNAKQVDLEYKLATGQLDNPAELTLATAQASNSALLLMTLRDRAMDVYNELMRISL
ncbi:flagellar hook-basal body complex protein FliE [Lawsonibacter sp. JLR.KK007]|uniref:flagellar hook-basal body complex protein FliE n=1 Tax=Lawsonibacter sp. JLR.KK007 TaxID=3114293 RepID=UPI002FF2034E